jgi:hypothetical protein
VLSKRSRLFPESLLLDGVEKKSSYAVAGGSFGDIWMGSREGKTLAIKVMRCSDTDVKASPFYFTVVQSLLLSLIGSCTRSCSLEAVTAPECPSILWGSYVASRSALHNVFSVAVDGEWKSCSISVEGSQPRSGTTGRQNRQLITSL